MAHITDAVAGVMRFEVAEHFDRAGAGAQQSGQDAEQGGFARAVFADEDVAAARLEIDRNLAERGKRAEELGDFVQTGGDWPGAGGENCGLGSG